jgi:hypothetical protein
MSMNCFKRLASVSRAAIPTRSSVTGATIFEFLNTVYEIQRGLRDSFEGSRVRLVKGRPVNSTQLDGFGIADKQRLIKPYAEFST